MTEAAAARGVRGGRSAAEAGTAVAAAVKVAPGAGPPSPTLGHSPGFARAWALLPEGLGLPCLHRPEAQSSPRKSRVWGGRVEAEIRQLISDVSDLWFVFPK